MKAKILPAVAALGLAASAAGLFGADSGDPEARMRETLRTTMIQLRDAQTEAANAEAARATLEGENKALKAKVALLAKHAGEDQDVSSKEIESQKAKIADQQGEIARLQQQMSEWKAAAEKAAAASRSAAADRDKQSVAAVTSERRVEDLLARNAELFRIGSEILDRYQKFSLGAQFLAREPFIGRARTELENQISDDEDRLLAERATP